MARASLTALAVSLVSGLAAGQQLGQPPLSFVKVADTSTPVPGGTGNFTLFVDARDFDGTTAVFNGYDSASREGLYSFRNGSLQLLVNENTVVPGSGATFNIFYDVAVEGSAVFFTAGWSGGTASGCAFSPNEGLFMVPLGSTVPMTLADSNGTPFSCFQGVDVDGGQVVVTGGNNAVDGFHNHQEAILRLVNFNSLTTLVDTGTAIPGGGGATFVGFDQEVAYRNGSLAFGEIVPNSIPPLMGVYVDDGSLRVLANATTPVPGGTGTFQDIRGLNYDGDAAAFRGVDANNLTGLYVGTGPGDLRVVVDRNTRVPGTPFRFLGFSNPMAFSDGVLAFTGFWTGGGIGLFVWHQGRVTEILRRGDLLDGLLVEQAFCYHGQLVGNRMLIRVLSAGFTDRALYIVQLPIPTRLGRVP